MALSALSLNFLKFLIPKYIFVPFQRVQIFCIVHFQVYLNLIELNKNLTGSSIFMSEKKSHNREHHFYLLIALNDVFFLKKTVLVWRHKIIIKEVDK